MNEAAAPRKSTDLTPEDQARAQRIVDHIKLQTGLDAKTPDAIRAAFSAWEQANLNRPNTTHPSIAQNPEAHQAWLDREIDKQQNPDQ